MDTLPLRGSTSMTYHLPKALPPSPITLATTFQHMDSGEAQTSPWQGGYFCFSFPSFFFFYGGEGENMFSLFPLSPLTI